MSSYRYWLLMLLGWSLSVSAPAATWAQDLDTSRGDRMIAAYFEQRTAALRDGCLSDIDSLDEWLERRSEYHQQLLEMLGLWPWPERTELHAETTRITELDEFVVERVHFQSRPGLYVTGNLYRPKQPSAPLPAVLYVCGHGSVKKDGVSYGSKAHYQHHGGWFARNGYVCLTIDTLQLGEIEGIHHGTYRYGRWWWLNRGYSPAGVEAWNCVRALDYLQSREDVDPERLGVTGRSGGGAYSWWIAAVDQRIKAAVPVAGITDLQNHVVDGCVEGHCDCMYMVNTYRWDYPLVAALVAPRPLLISNTDQDSIFPLDGVVRTYEKVAPIYALYDQRDNLGLHITAGGHKDTQELRVHAFRWLNQHLQGNDSLIETTAVRLLEPEQLRVFDELPGDQRNTAIDETFVDVAPPIAVPSVGQQWQQQRQRWLEELKSKTFRAWPDEPVELDLHWVATAHDKNKNKNKNNNNLTMSCCDFTSQEQIRLRLYLVHRTGLEKPQRIVLHALDSEAWPSMLATYREAFPEILSGEMMVAQDAVALQQVRERLVKSAEVFAYVAPRGVGPTAWDATEKKQVQHQRRFYLLGETLDGMQTYDVVRAIDAIRQIDLTRGEAPLVLDGRRRMAGVCLYASLMRGGVDHLQLHQPPASHRDGPYLLNVSRILDLPQTLAMVGEDTRVVLYQTEPQAWQYAADVARTLGWPADRIAFEDDE